MAGKLISPGVLVQEIDISNIVPQVATSIGAMVGTATKGPIIGDTDSPTLVTNQSQFLDTFGEPDGGDNSYMHYAALQFLEAGNSLYVTRVINDAATYPAVRIGGLAAAKVDGTSLVDIAGVASGSRDDDPCGGDYLFKIISKVPGNAANNLSITIINFRDFQAHGESIIDLDTEGFYFEDVPNHVEEFILAVYDGALNEYVESFTVSRSATRRDARGRSMYLENVINVNSNYIYVSDNPRSTGPSTLDATVQPMSTLGLRFTDGDSAGANAHHLYVWDATGSDATNITRITMGGGSDGTTGTISDGKIIEGWETFRNPDNIDVNILIMAGPSTATAVGNAMINIATDRGDCIAIIDPPYANSTPMSIVNWKKKTWNPNTSYAALYWPWVKIYDRFQDSEEWVPPSTFAGYVYALTDYTREPWFAPAGLNRGIINTLDVQYKPTQGERDLLYMYNINPIAFFPGEGTAIWGQKTLQTKASALDRVNVRRLLLVLEKAVAKAAKYMLFEPNDRYTRVMFTHMVEPFLRDIQGRRGITYFRVICDNTNNPPAVIDRNELIMDIYIQPTKAAEFITLKFNILRTGVLAEELV